MELPAFFFDIDGTLLDYPHQLTSISPATIKALDQLREKHPTFIASGRTHCFIDPEIRKYPFDGFVTCNGAYVEYQGQCIYKKAMSKISLQAALQTAKALNAILYLESRDYIYTYNANLAMHQVFVDKWAMDPKTIITDFDPDKIEVFIGMIVAEKEEDCPKIIEALSGYFDVSQHVNQSSFDLTLSGENKATGIRHVMTYFHSDLSQAWAFGDGNNDIEMIQSVGHGIAMGNAVDALKAVAYDVTDDACQDGIVKSLKKYHWIAGEVE